MQPTEESLYFITDEQGRTYYRDPSTGLLSASGANPVPLSVPPKSFEDQSIQWVRSIGFNGVMTSMSAPFIFERDAAFILRSLLYSKKWIQSYARLVCQFRDNNNRMRDAYRGVLDLSTCNDVQGAAQEEGVSCESVQEGINEMIFANRSTTYEMKIDVPEAIDVTMDGIVLYSNVRAIKYSDNGFLRYRAVTIIGTVLPSTETIYPSLLWNDQTITQDVDSLNQVNDDFPDEWLFKVQETTNVTIDIPHFRFFAATSFWRIGYWCINEINGTTRFVQLASGSTGGFPVDYDIHIQDVNTFNPGEKVFFVFEMNVDGAGESSAISPESDDISFVYDYRKSPTVVKWLTPMYVFSELIKRITKGLYGVKSDLFTATIPNVLMTSGNAIRGFSDAVLNISLDNFLKSYNVPFPLSLNTNEGVARVENEAFAYNSAVLPSLGPAASLRVYNSPDHTYNKFRFGWPDVDYNDVNGRYEFNTNSLYGTEITKVDKEFDGVSFAHAGCFEIEFARINLENKKTTDSNSDDTVFMLDALYTGAKTAVINRPASLQVSGIPNASSVFNVRLRPSACARAHGAKIRTSLFMNENTTLEYLSKSKNVEIFVTENGVTTGEKSNIPVSSLPPKLYLPVKVDVSVQTASQIRDYLAANPGGQLPFEWEVNGRIVELKGFVMKASQQPVYLSNQTFELLLTADTDITKLIY